MESIREKIESILIDSTKRQMMAVILNSDFQLFIKYVHFAINESEFTFKPFHLTIIKKLQDIEFGNNKKRNLCLCLPVGSGKSLLVEYFIAWSFCRSINKAFLYTSHSNTNIMKLSREVKEMFEHEFIASLYGIKLKQDERSKINWSFENAMNRTGLVAKPTGAGLTGADAGHRGIEGFSGCVICFPYDEIVRTDKGKLKIGDIVSKKLNVKVYSYNHDLEKVELKEIDRYLTNPGDDLLEIKLDDGAHIRCTPNHEIYTLNRGYIEAKDLLITDILPSDPFNLPKANTKLICNILSFFRPITDKFNFLIRKLSSFRFFVISNTFCKLFPKQTCFYTNHSCTSDPIFLSNFSNSFLGLSNFDCLEPSKHVSGAFLMNRKRTMFNGISHVIRFTSIPKIVQGIINRVPIKVSNFHTFFLRPYKSPHKSLMDINSFTLPVSVCSNFKITFAIRLWFYNLLFYFHTRPLRAMYNSFFGSNNPCIRNTIVTNPSRNRSPLYVRKIGHCNTSYCLTIRGNHNMYVGKCKAILASNCDDPMDIEKRNSEIELENVKSFYSNKLATRRRTPTTPFIIIMQRISLKDLVQYIKENELDEYDIVEIPALSEEGESFWPEMFPPQELEKIRTLNPEKFYSQYQQNPIAGGNAIYKREWFKYYQELPELKQVIQSWDTAFKKGQDNDYSVCSTWGIAKTQFGDKYYLIDVWRGKLEYPQLKAKFIELQNKYNPFSILVEDKASGQSLLQDLKQAGNNRLKPIKVDSDKETRTHAITALFEGGSVYFPKDNNFMPQVLDELLQFPNGAHDDINDSITQFLNWANKPRQELIMIGGSGIKKAG